jgi:hypothetical protein
MANTQKYRNVAAMQRAFSIIKSIAAGQDILELDALLLDQIDTRLAGQTRGVD